MVGFGCSNGAGVSGFGLPLLRVPIGRTAVVRMVSDEQCSVATHWVGRRSVACLGGDNDCPGCQVSPLRVLGYFLASVEVAPMPAPVLVEVPAASLVRLAELCGNDWCGRRFSVTRRSAKRPLQFDELDRAEIWPAGYGGQWRLFAAVGSLYRWPMPGRDESAKSWEARTLEARRRALRNALASEQ